MASIDALIEQIIEASRRKGGRAFSPERVYGDEPILMRGSQMASYLPEPIRQMRALARSSQARAWTDARLFVEQARLMVDYEDDCPYSGTFQSYFPTYDAMSDRQLRGYFTWRARVRSGSVEETSTSFAYVYLYELLNGIGTEPGERGFAAIEAFWRAYRAFEPAMDRYVGPWLVDYVVYHGLDPALAEPYADAAHDRAVATLARAEQHALEVAPTRSQGRGRRRTTRSYGLDPAADEALLVALDELSTYRIRDARLYRDAPDDVLNVTCAVFDRLARYYHSSRSQGLVPSLFGTRHAMPHLMFASAVFYPGGRHPDCVYELGETRRYECRNGIWTCDALHDGGGRSAKLGQVLRAVDRQLRAALDYPHPLKERGDPKYLTQLIEREVTDYLTWKRAHAPRRVEIDLSKLAGIRSAAAVTREALLVDEEREDVASPSEATSPRATPEPPAVSASETMPGPGGPEPASAQPAPDAEGASSIGLDADELALLKDLLGGQTPAGNADLLVDSINEKLFDLLGDTAVEFGPDGEPALVEDYVDDVRNAMGRLS